MKMLLRVLLLCGFAALVSCRTPPTEIVLRVETDIDQGPGHTLTDVRVRVAPASPPGDAVHDMTYPLGAHNMPLLPADIGITPRDNDARRSVLVEVTAISNGTELFTYRAIARFEAEHTNLLSVFLANRCTIQANRDMCSPSQTCGREHCEDVEHTMLPPFDPDASTDVPTTDIAMDVPTDTPSDIGTDAMDSGIDAPDSIDVMDATTDGPPCGTGMQLCNGACVANDDVRHCGACSNDCTALVNVATATCTAGTCGITCQSGFGDCDSMVSTGCETRVNTGTNCGTCGHACTGGTLCALSGSSFSCVTGCGSATMCGSSCVDTVTDPANCGSCSNACPMPANGVPTCSASTCGISCDTMYHACPGSTQCFPDSDLTHCGAGCLACPARAHATSMCTGGTCAFTCAAGYADCNGVPGDGCEQALSSTSSCGACGRTCSAGESCVNLGSGYMCTSTCPAGMPCSPSACASGVYDCSTGSARCIATGMFAAGTTCPGGVCNGLGTCVPCTQGALCSTGSQCQTGTIQCSSGNPVCAPSNSPPGTACSGGVCNGTGTCVPCVPGMVCNPGIQCRTGRISCTTGAPVCNVTGIVAAGGACTGGTCDGSGNCSACTSGPCDTGNPCRPGFMDCEAGGCTATGNAPPGTQCGTDLYCDSSGNCNSCVQGADCSTECMIQSIDCGMGFPMCMRVMPQPSGTTCSTGVCDGAGNCGPACISGTSCGPSGPCVTYIQECDPTACNPVFDPMGTSCRGTPGTCDGLGMCRFGGG